MLRDIGTLAVRSVVGLSIASHGAQKAFGWFDGPGADGAAQFMESLRFKPGRRYALLSSYTEMTAGLLLVLGLGGPIGPAMLCSVMVVAQASVHAKNGFFAQKQGVELGVLYAAAAIAIAMGGYGRISLDAALGAEVLTDERIVWLTLAGGALGGIFMLARRQSETLPPAPDQAR